ncbi:hypothetical protein QTP88_027556 [Uroleucon formosanum]
MGGQSMWLKNQTLSNPSGYYSGNGKLADYPSYFNRKEFRWNKVLKRIRPDVAYELETEFKYYMLLMKINYKSLVMRLSDVSIIGAETAIVKVKGRRQDTDQVRPSDGNGVCN